MIPLACMCLTRCRRYWNEDNFNLQFTIHTEFKLSDLTKTMPVIGGIVDQIIEIEGSLTFSVCVTQRHLAIRLLLSGSISILPSLSKALNIPKISGQIGLLLTADFNSDAPLVVGIILDAKLYALTGYGRGVGGVLTACPPNHERQGALCYKRCPPDYYMTSVGNCHRQCPAGFTPTGLHCLKPGETVRRKGEGEGRSSPSGGLGMQDEAPTTTGP